MSDSSTVSVVWKCAHVVFSHLMRSDVISTITTCLMVLIPWRAGTSSVHGVPGSSPMGCERPGCYIFKQFISGINKFL